MASKSAKSSKSKYIKLGALVAVVAAGITIPVVMISGIEEKEVYKGYKGGFVSSGNSAHVQNYKGNLTDSNTPTVAMITDGGNIHDGAFNESAIWGVQLFSGKLTSSKTYKVFEVANNGTEKDEFIKQYTTADPTLAYVVSGYRHASVGGVKDWWNHQSGAKPVVAVDIEDKVNDEFYGITFRTEQSGFLAALDTGFILNKTFKDEGKNDAIKVATFGGIKASSVTPYMNGFANGIKYWNSHKTEVTIEGVKGARDMELIHVDNDAQKDFSNTFELGAAKPLVRKLIAQGAKAIMAVAGQETKDIVDVINEQEAQGGVFAIGVDADQSSLYGGAVITSAVKNMEIATNNVLVKIEAADPSDLPKDTVYSLEKYESQDPNKIIWSVPNSKYLTGTLDASHLRSMKDAVATKLGDGTIDAQANPLWTPIDI